MRNLEPCMKVLLTGVSGNLGHTLATMLLDRGDIPVILDIVSVRNSGTQVWPFWISASGRGAVSFRKGTDASNPADRVSQLMRRACRLFPHHSDQTAYLPAIALDNGGEFGALGDCHADPLDNEVIDLVRAAVADQPPIDPEGRCAARADHIA